MTARLALLLVSQITIRSVSVLDDDLSALIHAAVEAYLMGSLILAALGADRKRRSLELPNVGSSLHFTSM